MIGGVLQRLLILIWILIDRLGLMWSTGLLSGSNFFLLLCGLLDPLDRLFEVLKLNDEADEQGNSRNVEDFSETAPSRAFLYVPLLGNLLRSNFCRLDGNLLSTIGL